MVPRHTHLVTIILKKIIFDTATQSENQTLLINISYITRSSLGNFPEKTYQYVLLESQRAAKGPKYEEKNLPGLNLAG